MANFMFCLFYNKSISRNETPSTHAESWENSGGLVIYVTIEGRRKILLRKN
jgi:hypothetical protein